MSGTVVGHAPLIKLDNGEIVIDDRNVRQEAFSGDFETYIEPVTGGVEFGAEDEDYIEEFEPVMAGGSFAGSDAFAGDELVYDGEGTVIGRRRRRRRRNKREDKPQNVDARKYRNWEDVMVADSTEIEDSNGGDFTLEIRLQHDFLSEGVTFEGSADSTIIEQIKFGKKTIFDGGKGVPAKVFAVNSRMLDKLKGQHIRGGLDIVITGRMSVAGEVFAIFSGKEPSS